MTMVGLSMGVLLAISSRSLFSFRGIASFWWGDRLNLAEAQRIAATPYTHTYGRADRTRATDQQPGETLTKKKQI